MEMLSIDTSFGGSSVYFRTWCYQQVYFNVRAHSLNNAHRQSIVLGRLPPTLNYQKIICGLNASLGANIYDLIEGDDWYMREPDKNP
jgi:hypothetical protein